MVVARDDDRVGLIEAHVRELGAFDYLLLTQRFVLVLREVEDVHLRYKWEKKNARIVSRSGQ